MLCAATLVLAAGTPARANDAAGTGTPVFGTDVVIPNAGGAPSIAVDTTGLRSRNDLYVAAPVSHTVWRSSDLGKSFSTGTVIGAASTGSGNDLAVDQNGAVVTVDLNSAGAWVQRSTDEAASFNSGSATAPNDDRPWVAVDGANVYVGYRSVSGGLPLVCRSTDGGQSFAPCAPVDNAPMSTTSGQCVTGSQTAPARPLAVDPVAHTLNFLFSCATPTRNAAHPPYGPLHDYFLAQSSNAGASWTIYPVFIADTSNGKQPDYANVFGTLRIDPKGTFYALIDGTADDRDPANNPYHVYLLTSRDSGHSWSAPKQVDHDFSGKGTHVLADLVGLAPGYVDVAWYGSSYTGEPNGVCGSAAQPVPCKGGFPAASGATAPTWNVYLAQSTNALTSKPTWTEVVVNKTPTHYGRICTNGMVCSASDHTLLDFISVVADCSGNAHVAYAANDKAETHTDVHVASQTAGTRLMPTYLCAHPPVDVPETGRVAWLLLVGALGMPAAILVGRRRRLPA